MLPFLSAAPSSPSPGPLILGLCLPSSLAALPSQAWLPHIPLPPSMQGQIAVRLFDQETHGEVQDGPGEPSSAPLGLHPNTASSLQELKLQVSQWGVYVWGEWEEVVEGCLCLDVTSGYSLPPSHPIAHQHPTAAATAGGRGAGMGQVCLPQWCPISGHG